MKKGLSILVFFAFVGSWQAAAARQEGLRRAGTLTNPDTADQAFDNASPKRAAAVPADASNALARPAPSPSSGGAPLARPLGPGAAAVPVPKRAPRADAQAFARGVERSGALMMGSAVAGVAVGIVAAPEIGLGVAAAGIGLGAATMPEGGWTALKERLSGSAAGRRP